MNARLSCSNDSSLQAEAAHLQCTSRVDESGKRLKLCAVLLKPAAIITLCSKSNTRINTLHDKTG
jgi:hypothetical protein